MSTLTYNDLQEAINTTESRYENTIAEYKKQLKDLEYDNWRLNNIIREHVKEAKSILDGAIDA